MGASMQRFGLAVALVLLAVSTASAAPEAADSYTNANSVVPEAEFIDDDKYDLKTPLKSADEMKQDKIVRAHMKVMKKAITVPEVPKGQAAYQKKVTDEEKAATDKGTKDLHKNAHDRDWHAEGLRLRKDHEGSLDPNSPWNKAE